VVNTSSSKENTRQAILIGFTRPSLTLGDALDTKASKIMLLISGNATNGIEIQSFNHATPQRKKKIANVPTDIIKM
jgi:hypothetical protein